MQIDTVDAELRLLAREDQRLLALQTIYGIGPVLACHLLAEIGRRRRGARESPDPLHPGRAPGTRRSRSCSL